MVYVTRPTELSVIPLCPKKEHTLCQSSLSRPPRRYKQHSSRLISEVYGRSASYKCLESCLDSISTQRRIVTSLHPQSRLGNLFLLTLSLQLRLPVTVRTPRMRRPHHRRRHLRKTRSGVVHLTFGMPCSYLALRLVQGRELPPTSCVATLTTNYSIS
jgi:hypothetical protein